MVAQMVSPSPKTTKLPFSDQRIALHNCTSPNNEDTNNDVIDDDGFFRLVPPCHHNYHQEISKIIDGNIATIGVPFTNSDATDA